MNKICCFCEKIYSNEAIFCGFCNEYKGLMSVEEFDTIYGKEILPL